MADKFLDKVYGVTEPGAVRDLYDDWSSSYDDEVAEAGYITPARCAAALAAHLTPHTASILDFGCGTGLSGQALAALGFTTIDGVDLSAGMMETAEKRGVYRSLRQIDANDLQIEHGAYAAIAAVGVISTGAAPASTLGDLMACLAPGGMIVFSFNDHALEDPSFEAAVQAELDRGRARALFRDYDDHLPGRGLKSVVYVLERL
ncbi:MAG: class I SAM-dependent methyltransferase [Pseudomonadota bacterium]